MVSQFTWIPIYTELAGELLNWQDKQTDLIGFLKSLDEKGLVITPLNDKDEDGSRFLVKEIDPFTFLGVFNRGITENNRLLILQEYKKLFNLSEALPEDFDGIPVINNQNSWFFPYQYERGIEDILKLWQVFRAAMGSNPLESKEFAKAFDRALEVKGTNVNLTMGLFWIRPDIFINLDRNNRQFLDISLPASGLNSYFYLKTIKNTKSKYGDFPQVSLDAWKASEEPKKGEPAQAKQNGDIDLSIDYWLVGAYWDSQEPADQTERFVAEGIWENGYKDRLLDEVKSMKAGDKIAIKAAGTQKLNLPFDSRNKTISRMEIKATGTVVKNRNDGRVVEVEWDAEPKEKYWFFYTYRGTIWHLNLESTNKHIELAKQLVQFVWHGKPQNYEFFTNYWWGEGIEDENNENGLVLSENQPYSIDDMVTEGVFLKTEEIETIIKTLKNKKVIILQGPPGVGKTFVARKIAFALMEEIDRTRIEFIQFHQSYSYDDFIRGFRPSPDDAGTFKIQNGIFYEFCQKAINDPERDYVFIIDEINRGNLSQIFGELLMLIEHDKRGQEYAVPLVYRNENEPRFFVPSNLYLIGLMNLADRSLAMVDYAIRRRFGFISLTPQYEQNSYKDWLGERLMPQDLIEKIQTRLGSLNRVIAEDPLLGENYLIGHSYFCPRGDNFSALDENWYANIIRTEIVPLLREYWFDNREKADEAERNLLP